MIAGHLDSNPLRHLAEAEAAHGSERIRYHRQLIFQTITKSQHVRACSENSIDDRIALSLFPYSPSSAYRYFRSKIER